ncbi:WbqC family protein [Streptomyces olivaceiscleroticus]|uniref:WbqC-like protein n=1 Tax=Streptomyces olivaceiscleroticus TaxID=68245 RepID=A0ABN1AG20_9ACTN
MPRTCLSPTQGLPADSSPHDLPAPGGLCAIHQPNLFPRLSTLAKLFAADYWIVLDDVQFARRDYQHRARLAALDRPQQRQWLTLPTHLPHGRATLIREARLADPIRSRRRITHMLSQHYRSSPFWPTVRSALVAVIDQFAITDRTAVVAEMSTRILLDLLGWKGQVLHSSEFTARADRSLRLLDLASTTKASGYLCGPGGMKYLRRELFVSRGVPVVPFRTPAVGTWQGAREISSLSPLLLHGPEDLAEELQSLAAFHGESSVT